MKIVVELDVPEDLCQDLLTTAVEGGSNWLTCHRVERDEDLNVVRLHKPYDVESGEDFSEVGITYNGADITKETIFLGIQRILSGQVAVNSMQYQWLLSSVVDPENCNWDADTADLVLQAGMFNEIVFS
jgi:hypothetical protein